MCNADFDQKLATGQFCFVSLSSSWDIFNVGAERCVMVQLNGTELKHDKESFFNPNYAPVPIIILLVSIFLVSKNSSQLQTGAD